MCPGDRCLGWSNHVVRLGPLVKPGQTACIFQRWGARVAWCLVRLLVWLVRLEGCCFGLLVVCCDNVLGLVWHELLGLLCVI